ncbi:triple tyrosine motif-containing protein, partial [Marivirga sp.]|uniref:triple tyrosine motif-containing protein n=1 Tax=Marivirga sp. TaxID=2018662 RepID=UPI0025F80F34
PEVTLFKNDTLWVGTTEGLFYLNEVKDYETLQKKLFQKVRISSPEKSSAENEESNNFLEGLFNSGSNKSEEDFIDNELKKYREIYRNEGIRFLALKRKLDEKEQQIRDSIQYANSKKTNSQKNKSSSTPKYRTVVKTIDISRLKSIDFEYQKIKGIDGHVESLTNTDEGLIARSNTGIFILNSESVTKISNLKMVKKVLYRKTDKLLWLTNEQGLFSLDLSSNNYILKKHSDNTFNDLIFINNQLIAVGYNTIEIFSLQDNSLKTIQKLNIVNNFSEELNIFMEDGKIKLLRSDAILELDSSSSKLKIDSVFNPPLKYFLKDQNEQIWILSSQDEWSIINGELSSQAKKWLHIVPPVKGINMINDSTIFFSTNERIIRWKYSSSEDYPMPKTFIDGVMVENKWVKNKGFIKLHHGQNNLKVILSTPEYLFKEDIEYQYYVKGLMDEWSTWSKNRELDFPYIPTGDYKLQINARTILNNEVSNFDFNFEVMPPYWQTWWFYILEIAFFSILILISIKLNTTSQSSYLTKTFTFLTLILFLEFLATVLENNLEGYVDESPVYTFIINVILALSISPIEKGISKLLIVFNSSRSKKLISKMRKNQLKKKNE